MDSRATIEKLFKSNIITKAEYEKLMKRLEITDTGYVKAWGEILDDFYGWCTQKYSLITAKGYKTCLYKFMLYLTGKDNNESAFTEQFAPYTFRQANSLIADMTKRMYSQQAINKTAYAIAVFGDYLRSVGIDVPDTRDIKVSIKKEVNNTTIALKHDEIMAMSEIGELRNRVCLLLCYEGALKRAELCNVRIQDFNFQNKQLVIYSDEKIDRVCLLSDKTVELTNRYIQELYENIASWNASRVAKGRTPREDYGYLFQSVKMIKPSYSVLQVMLKNTAKMYYEANGNPEEVADKVKQVTFETIRNSRRVYLLHKGYDVREVMAMCGDKNYMSTHRFSKLVNLLYPNG